MVWGRWHSAVAGLVLLLPGSAAAVDLPGSPSTAAGAAPKPDWIVTIGAELEAVPAWPGAPTSLYGLSGTPLVGVQRPGDPPIFFGPRDGFGVPVVDIGSFQAGPAGKLVFPRYQGQYIQLNGLGDVRWAVQLGAFVTYWAVPWLRLHGEIRQGFGGETGITGDLFMDAVVPIGQWRLSGGPRLTLQSAAATAPYFNITPAQSAASTISGLPALPAYNATGGLYSYGAGGQAEYSFNRQWSILGFVEYQRLADSAADSPLVTMRGSPNQFMFGIGATYTFAMRPLW
jgi:outer membrane protein